LDYLIVDTPPGTSDEHLSITQYMKSTGISGALIISTPQEVALMDVRKEINFCKKVGIPIIGVVENMSSFICPKCNNETKIFVPSSGGVSKMCQEMEVPFLVSIPLDPRIARCSDQGEDFLKAFPSSPASQAFNLLVHKVKTFLGEAKE